QGNIDHFLRVHLQISYRLGQAQPVAPHGSQDLQGGNNAIASSMTVETQQMAGALATKEPPPAHEAVKPVPVTNLGALELNAPCVHGFLEAEVGHERTHYTLHLALGVPVAHDGVQELVAIVDATGFIDHQQAVGVAVQSNTHMSTARSDFSRHCLGMQCADTLIDIEAVRLTADGKNLGTQFAEDMGSNLVGSTVSSIYHNLHPRQIKLVGEGAFAKLNVATRGIVNAPSPAQVLGIGATQGLIDHRFDTLFDLIGQLHALRRKKLDAVILVGV